MINKTLYVEHNAHDVKEDFCTRKAWRTHMNCFCSKDVFTYAQIKYKAQQNMGELLFCIRNSLFIINLRWELLKLTDTKP